MDRGYSGVTRERELLPKEEEGKESFPRRRHGRLTRMLAQGSGMGSWNSRRRGVEARSGMLQGGHGEVCLKTRPCGERLKPSQESRVRKRLDCYLELGLYPEGWREPVRNLSTGWGMTRFEGQFHSETKQRRNSPQPPPQDYWVKIVCLEHLETKALSWQSGR